MSTLRYNWTHEFGTTRVARDLCWRVQLIRSGRGLSHEKLASSNRRQTVLLKDVTLRIVLANEPIEGTTRALLPIEGSSWALLHLCRLVPLHYAMKVAIWSSLVVRRDSLRLLGLWVSLTTTSLDIEDSFQTVSHLWVFLPLEQRKTLFQTLDRISLHLLKVDPGKLRHRMNLQPQVLLKLMEALFRDILLLDETGKLFIHQPFYLI